MKKVKLAAGGALCAMAAALAAAAQNPAPAKSGGERVVALVSVANQKMTVYSGARKVAEYAVSTAKAGVGSMSGSNKTPPGMHRIAAFFGSNAALGQVFKSRRAVRGRVLPESEWRTDGGEDLVTTRILWLDGLEPGVNKGGNVDSKARCIYIHGTNQEHLLGVPASHGCIRMSNRDVVKFYDYAKEHSGMRVKIEDDAAASRSP